MFFLFASVIEGGVAKINSFYNKFFNFLLSLNFLTSKKLLYKKLLTVPEAPAENTQFCKSLANFKQLALDASRATNWVVSRTFFYPV
jgi:hypothetical protein